jgi:ketosteroid isomerase-like protein
MKLRNSFRLLIAVSICAGSMTAGCTRVKDLAPPAVDLAGVRALDSAGATAWLSNAPEQVMALFTPGAVISPSGIPVIQGHEAMRAFWWPPDSPTAVVTKFDLLQKWAEGSGGLAVVRGTFELNFDYDGDSYSSTDDYNTTLTRSDDGPWHIHFRAWNDLPDASS